MVVTRIIELIAGSPKSWEEAVKNAVREASKNTKGIRRVYVKRLMGNVRDGEIVEWRAEVRMSAPLVSQE